MNLDTPEKKIIAFFLLILIAVNGYRLLTGISLDVYTMRGDSMQRSIPEGNMILMERKDGLELYPGEVGCYNDPEYSKYLNVSQFIQCHWVNQSYYENGIHYYKFITDKFDCYKLNDNEFCSVYGYDIPATESKGRVLLVMLKWYENLAVGIGLFVMLYILMMSLWG